MRGGPAERTGFSRLQRGAPGVQLFDFLFLLAEGFHIQIVLVFLFIALAQGGQPLFEAGLLGLAFLLIIVNLRLLFLQRLVAGLQGGETLAHGAQPEMARYRLRRLFRRQRQGAGGAGREFLLMFTQALQQGGVLAGIPLPLIKEGAPAGDVLAPEAELTVLLQPAGNLFMLCLQGRYASGRTVTDPRPPRRQLL